MRVVVSVGGRFHAFNLAHQLERRGFLERLITSYPKFVAKRYGIPADKVSSLLSKEIIQRTWERLPAIIRRLWNPQFFLHQLFAQQAETRLPVLCDIFVGFSAFSLEALQTAQSRAAATILECGSSHIAYCENILKDEYDRFGVQWRSIHGAIKEKMLTEYEVADSICIPSSFVRNTFLAHDIPSEKLFQVPYGVDLQNFFPGEKNDTVFRVVYAGGMTLQKGVHYLLRAFHELCLQKTEMCLIGRITDEILPFFKRYAGSFRHHEAVLQGQLQAHYSQGSVFVLNSIQDGFGMVIAQAMACGLPVIATDHSGGPDIIRDGVDGFIIPIRDVAALKEKITYLYENPEICKQMGESARERVAHGFTWDDYGDRMVKEYERILVQKNA